MVRVRAAIHSATGPWGPWGRTSYIDISHLLVLCHMDLHMRNFILDANIAKGKLWLQVVDWENAGAFPPWLEYAHCMALWADAAREEARPPKFSNASEHSFFVSSWISRVLGSERY
jgi:thiamine kinase-like enzyme